MEPDFYFLPPELLILHCSSSEVMGNRAPVTTAVLEQLPELSLSYRSDLDGPIRKPSSST